MKKYTLLILAIVLFLSAPAVHAQNVQAALSFNQATNILNISGNIGTEKGTVVTLTIAKSNHANFSSSNTPDFMYLYETQEGGKLQVNIAISNKIESGKYNVYFDSKKGSAVYTTMIVKLDDSGTKNVIKLINDSTSQENLYNIISNAENANKIGIDVDNEEVSSYIEYVAGICYAKKSEMVDGKYTVDTFYTTFNESIACAFLTQTKNVDKTMLQYAAVFGITYSDYQSIDNGVKNNLKNLLVSANYASGSPSKIYREKLVSATVMASQTWGYLKDNVLQFADEIGIKVGTGFDYSKIGSDSTYKVFTAMFSEKSNLTSFDNIKKSFNNAVSDVLKSSGSTSTSTGGSVGSSSKHDVSSGKGGSVILPLDTSSVTMPVTKVVFGDLANHWSKDYVEKLVDKKVISGFPDNTFKPEQNVTRAEFVKMMVLLFVIENNHTSDFEDVSDSEWYKTYVNIAVGAELVFGNEGKFNPNDAITRQDAAVIINRLGNVANKSEFAFEDSTNINDYAREAVAKLSVLGVIQGSEGKFYPQNSITRGEASTMLCKAFEKFKE